MMRRIEIGRKCANKITYLRPAKHCGECLYHNTCVGERRVCPGCGKKDIAGMGNGAE